MIKNKKDQAGIPINQEHLEAKRDEIFKERETYANSLKGEAAAKFKAVKKACEILEESGVNYWLFPFLQREDLKEGEEALLQYNSIGKSMKFDETGKVTKESQNFVRYSNESLMYYVFAQYYMKELSHISQCETDSDEALFAIHGFVKKISALLLRHNNELHKQLL